MTRKPPSYQDEKKDQPKSKKKLILFKIISALLPFFVLLIIELLLRVFHYGYDPRLFIESSSDGQYMVMNPNASRVYFTNQAIATTGNVEPFRKEKGINTFRIFVLGESTTIGYPFFHNGSFHRWLQYRLMHEFPEKNFEIINLSLTAVNSYTVLGFAKQLLNYEPDAVLIYTGHNEYYGALGVASTDKLGGNQFLVKTVIRVRQLKLGQLLTNIIAKLSNVFAAKKSPGGKTRMELMVGDQQIAFQSHLYQKGIAQFRNNMDETLRLLNSKNIPVFISNLVSNEKNLPPFINIDPDSLQVPDFQKNYHAAIQALQTGDSITASSSFTRANQAYSLHASCNFYLGRLALAKQAGKNASAYLSKAKDLDALRFRAPTAINDVIRELCSRYTNTHLVDSKSLFEDNSAGKIIGDELMMEHVHPNLMGYALLSEGFYTALRKENLPAGTGTPMSFRELLKSMPITAMDSLAGKYRIDHLKSGWPFKNAVAVFPDSSKLDTEEKRLAYAIAFRHLNWSDANANLYQYYISHHDLANAKILAESLVLEYPGEESYYNNAANICGELKDNDNAIFYFRKSFDLSPALEKARFLFPLYLLQDQPDKAIPYLEYVINNGTASLNSVRILAIQINELKRELYSDSINQELLNKVAAKYFEMGNRAVADKYVKKVLTINASNPDALQMQAQLKKTSR